MDDENLIAQHTKGTMTKAQLLQWINQKMPAGSTVRVEVRNPSEQVVHVTLTVTKPT